MRRENTAQRAQRQAQRARRAVPVCLLALALGLGSAASAATLRLGSPYTTEGGVAVPVWLAPAAQDDVASLQFQFAYDHNDFSITSVAAGPAASGAGKEVIFAGHGDLATVIVAGFNQDVLEGGLVATLYLSPTGDAQALGDIGITSPVFSDPSGEAVPPTLPNDDDTDSPGNTPSDPDEDSGEAPPPPTETPVTAPGNLLPNDGNNAGGTPSRFANGAPYGGLGDDRTAGDDAAREAGASVNGTPNQNNGLGYGAKGGIQGYGTASRGGGSAGQEQTGSYIGASASNGLGIVNSPLVSARASRVAANTSTLASGNTPSSGNPAARSGRSPAMLASATDGPLRQAAHARAADDTLPMLPRLAREAQRDPAPMLATICLVVVAASAGLAWYRVARRARR